MQSLNDKVLSALSELKAIMPNYNNDFNSVTLAIEEKIKILELMIKNRSGVKPFIINAGIYNAGKSLLFNAWIEQSIFPVGDIPTTAKNEIFETDEYILMDTPGIDANRDDDTEALTAYKSADIILGMANIQRGGIDAVELDYLKKILHWRGSEDAFNESVVFVLSNAHQVDESQCEKIAGKVKDSIKKEMGIEVKEIFCVDSRTFFEGLDNKNKELIEASKIGHLKSFVENKINLMGNKFESRYVERLKVVAKELIDEIDKIMKSIGKNTAPKAAMVDETEKTTESISEVIKKITNLKEAFYTIDLKLCDNPYPTPVPDYTSASRMSSDYDYDSMDEAKAAGESEFNSRYYDRRERKAKAIIREMKEKFNNYLYHEMKDGNFYHSINQKSAMLIQNVVDEIFKVIDDKTKISPTCLNFNVPYQGDPREIVEYLNGSDILDDISLSYLTSGYYIDTSSRRVTKSSFFSGEYQDTAYRYNLREPYEELKKDMSDEAAKASAAVWGMINSAAKSFFEAVKKEIDKRFEHFIQLLETADKENKEKLEKARAENDSLSKDINELEKILNKLKF